MKELQPQYYKGTKTYTQVHSSCHAYIYKVTDSETEHIYYEVFERHYNRRYDCISYPTDKAFGKWAWCISKGNDHIKALEAAFKRFDYLNKQKEVA